MTDENRSLASLISDLGAQGGTLLRTEARLLRAEFSEKLSKAGAAAIEILGGALCLLAALMVLLQALVIVLAETGLGGGWASLIVGIGVAIVGLILLRAGKAGLEVEEMLPEKTIHQVEQDAQAFKEQVR